MTRLCMYFYHFIHIISVNVKNNIIIWVIVFPGVWYYHISAIYYDMQPMYIDLAKLINYESKGGQLCYHLFPILCAGVPLLFLLWGSLRLTLFLQCSIKKTKKICRMQKNTDNTNMHNKLCTYKDRLTEKPVFFIHTLKVVCGVIRRAVSSIFLAKLGVI